jgi:hypothetical protein
MIGYIPLNIIEKCLPLNPKSSLILKPLLWPLSPLQSKVLPRCRSSVTLSFRATDMIFTRNRTQDSFFRGCGLLSCDLLETDDFGLGAILLSFLLLQTEEPPSPVIKLRTPFPDLWQSFVFSRSQGISMPSLV